MILEVSKEVLYHKFKELQKCLTKPDFLVWINGLAEPFYDPPNVEMKVTDSAVFVNMNPPRTSDTYGKHCDMELKTKVLRITDALQQVDIVFDTYQQSTMKSDRRDSRGKGIKFFVWQDTVFKKLQDFMRCDDNQIEMIIELFQMISSSLSKINCVLQIFTTKFLDVDSNCNTDTINLQPRNHERQPVPWL